MGFILECIGSFIGHRRNEHVPTMIDRRKKQKSPSKRAGVMPAYFDRLYKEKKLRLEDVAAMVPLSFATVASWKYGTRFPRPHMISLLELKFGVKVCPQE